MSKHLFSVLIFGLCSCLFTSPASAIYFDAAMSADCTGYQIHISGGVWITYTADYRFVTGSGEVLAEGSFDLPNTGVIDVTFGDSWNEPPCGATVITGILHLWTDEPPSEGSTNPSFDYTYESPPLDCTCEGGEPPVFWGHIGADCIDYRFHITGQSSIAYTAAYKFTIKSESGEIPVEGTLEIPGTGVIDVGFDDTWDVAPCGATVITGELHLTTDAVPPEGTIYPSFDFSFESPTLDCGCSGGSISLRGDMSADCAGYGIHITGQSSIAYVADYSLRVVSESGEMPIEGSFEIPGTGVIDVTFGDSWDVLPCGATIVTGEIHLTTDAVPPEGTTYPSYDFIYESPTLDCPCDQESPGTGTPGYWKNHPEAWPVETIEIGCEVYSKAEAIALMLEADGGDKLRTIFRSLVAAKLNVLIGNDDSCVADTIEAAEVWMCTYGPIGQKVVTASGKKSPWRTGEPLYTTLDAYNNGLLCAPHRD
jgi:hypothetical protein